MPKKPRTCNQQIAIDIRRYSLAAVKSAVDMAVELSTPAPAPRPKSSGKKPKSEAATAQG